MRKELRVVKDGSSPGCFSKSIGFFKTEAEKNQLKLNYLWENGDLEKNERFVEYS